MCQPGRPGPHGESHFVSSWALCAFQSEVKRIFLQVTGLLGDHLVGVGSGQSAVLGESSDSVVNVTTRLVGEPTVDELGDQGDDLRNRLGRQRLDVRPLEPEVGGVVEVPARRLLGQVPARDPLLGSRGVDLVVDVRDVLDEGHVVTLLDEPALHPEEDDVRTRVADVDPLVDRRAADIHADRPGGRG